MDELSLFCHINFPLRIIPKNIIHYKFAVVNSKSENISIGSTEYRICNAIESIFGIREKSFH